MTEPPDLEEFYAAMNRYEVAITAQLNAEYSNRGFITARKQFDSARRRIFRLVYGRPATEENVLRMGMK